MISCVHLDTKNLLAAAEENFATAAADFVAVVVRPFEGTGGQWETGPRQDLQAAEGQRLRQEPFGSSEGWGCLAGEAGRAPAKGTGWQGKKSALQGPH